MRKSLLESKADIESGIAKSLASAPLSPEELEELLSIDRESFIKDYDIDYLMVDQIRTHVESEKARVDSQSQMTRGMDEGLKRINSSTFHLENILDFDTIK